MMATQRAPRHKADSLPSAAVEKVGSQKEINQRVVGDYIRSRFSPPTGSTKQHCKWFVQWAKKNNHNPLDIGSRSFGQLLRNSKDLTEKDGVYTRVELLPPPPRAPSSGLPKNYVPIHRNRLKRLVDKARPNSPLPAPPPPRLPAHPQSLSSNSSPSSTPVRSFISAHLAEMRTISPISLRQLPAMMAHSAMAAMALFPADTRVGDVTPEMLAEKLPSSNTIKTLTEEASRNEDYNTWNSVRGGQAWIIADHGNKRGVDHLHVLASTVVDGAVPRCVRLRRAARDGGDRPRRSPSRSCRHQGPADAR